MRIPATPEAALQETERQSAWLRHRYPQVSPTANSSYTSNIGFWGCVELASSLASFSPNPTSLVPLARWPQVADDLLEDIGLKVMRSGGSWLTWPFRVVQIKEIAGLKEERDVRRARTERTQASFT